MIYFSKFFDAIAYVNVFKKETMNPVTGMTVSAYINLHSRRILTNVSLMDE